MPLTPQFNSSPSSSQSIHTKHSKDGKRKKKSWSAEAKNKKAPAKSRQQIKEMLIGKDRVKEEDVDAPPNSDAKDESLRFFEIQNCMPAKEEYVSKQPQIGLKRKVKKKGHRRADSLRLVRKRPSNADKTKMSREEASGGHVDTSLFKERASANNSNANSPDNSERKERARVREETSRSAYQVNRTMDSDGDNLPLAFELEQNQQEKRNNEKSKMLKVEQQASSNDQKNGLNGEPRRPAAQRSNRSLMGSAPSSTNQKVKRAQPLQPPQQIEQQPPSGDDAPQSTQLALEPEPDLDRVRRQKEAAFMKRFLTALKFLPNSTSPRSPMPPISDDSPSDSSTRRKKATPFKHPRQQNNKKKGG